MNVLVETPLGIVRVDLESEEAELVGDGTLPRRPHDLSLPLLLDADRHGSRIVALLRRRPPLVVSDDAGLTWRETGGGLPPGRSVAISPQHPDQIVFVTSSRIYRSEDGGRFWRVLAVELLDATAVAWEA